MMKTIPDYIYHAICPCWECADDTDVEPCKVCAHQTLVVMYAISVAMILGGEY